MQKYITTIALFLLLTVIHSAPPINGIGTVNLVADYPTNDITPDMVFKWYLSRDITTPMSNWVVVATTTNPAIRLPVTAGVNFFAITASNFWGESDFSNVASTPALPRSDVTLKVSRVE